MTFMQDIQDLRCRAGLLAGRWVAVDCTALDDRGERVAWASNPNLARYLVDLHNIFLPLSNAWLMVHKALRDRAELTKLLASEA